MKRKYQDQLAKIRKHFVTNTVIVSSLLVIMSSCKKSSEDTPDLVGNWVELSSFAGKPRSEAVTFTIGEMAYVGLGYNGEDRLTDFWKYDPSKDSWTQVDDFIGIGRIGAVAFAIGNKGYVGTGYDSKNKLNDFYEFDPSKPDSMQWTPIKEFGGSARFGAVAFSIGNKGYVGTGYDGYYKKDFWEYDPATNTWNELANFRGDKRRDATAFVIDGKGYIVTGINNGVYLDDFYEYDPTTDSWTEKGKISNALKDSEKDDDYINIVGISKVAFTINGKGYLTTGGPGTISGTVWEYTPATDVWIQRHALEGSERTDAVGFAIGNRGYITTGKSSSYFFDDIWGFDPTALYNDED